MLKKVVTGKLKIKSTLFILLFIFQYPQLAVALKRQPVCKPATANRQPQF